MQSDGNSLFGDIVLESFIKVSLDEENILDQAFKKKYVRITSMMICILYNIIQKFRLKTKGALNLKFISFLLSCALFL